MVRARWACAVALVASVGACLFPSLSSLEDEAGVSESGVETGVVEGGVPDGAALYLPFEEGVGTATADKIGNNNGNLVGGSAIAWTTAGKIGNAINFNLAPLDGGAYVDIPTSKTSALNVTGSVSVTAWINASAAPIDDAPIVSNLELGTPHGGFQLDTTIDEGPRALGFKLAINGDAGFIFARYGTTVFKLAQWYFVAAVYDANALALHVYVDGKLDDGALIGPVLGSIPTSNLDMNIGRRPGTTTAVFLGTIDEVRIYLRALTDAEIAGLYLE